MNTNKSISNYHKQEQKERSNLRWSNLSGSDLRGSNLSGSDLSESNLRGSNLRWSNLSGSDLSGSNLSGSDLRRSDLRGSDLSNIKLFDTIGNNKEIKTLQLGGYVVNYVQSTNIIQIGCENHTVEEWKNFSDDEISQMDIGALEWWNKWKDFIFHFIDLQNQ